METNCRDECCEVATVATGAQAHMLVECLSVMPEFAAARTVRYASEGDYRPAESRRCVRENVSVKQVLSVDVDF